jgi:hypothetical protein
MVKFPSVLTIGNTDRTIKALGSKKIGGDFKRYLKEKPDLLFTLYLLSQDTIAQVPWEEIVARESKLRITQYSLEDLKALNWTITYP